VKDAIHFQQHTVLQREVYHSACNELLVPEWHLHFGKALCHSCIHLCFIGGLGHIVFDLLSGNESIGIAIFDGESDDGILIQIRCIGLIKFPKEVRQVRRGDDCILAYEGHTILLSKQ
jgi:hypothetical protein